MKLIARLSLALGVVLFLALTLTSMLASKRDVPGDGLEAAQTLSASFLGFERSIICTWGDDGEHSEADRRAGQDNGAVHPHWMCDSDRVSLRRTVDFSPTSSEERLATVVGTGTELLVALALCAAGGLGIFLTRDPS